MSQEINLLDPSLRPKRDLLDFRSVSSVAVAVFVLICALSFYAAQRATGIAQAQSEAAGKLAVKQKELLALQSVLANRKPNPALAVESERLGNLLEQRKSILQLAQETTEGAKAGGADVMRGFSRQIVEGVWLTGFAVSTAGIDIRGRLLDPSLLPVYIRRLNAEPAFRGRRFAALDMQGSLPEAAQPPVAAKASLPGAEKARSFTEFVLRATQPPAATSGGKE